MEQVLSKDRFLIEAIRSFMENTPDFIFFKDVNLRYMAASLAFTHMVGHREMDDLLGLSDYDIFDKTLADRYTKDDRSVLNTGVPILERVEPLPDKNGKKSYSSTSKYPIRDTKGRVIGLCGVGRDVTAQIELKEEQERRELSRKMFEDVIEADVSQNRMLRVENSHWAKEMGLTEQSAFDASVRLFAELYIHEDYRKDFCSYYRIADLVRQYEQGIEAFSHISYQSVDGGQTYKWTEFCSRLYRSSVSGTLRITTFLRDLDREVRTKEQLQRKAEIDVLTGLYNRESTMGHIRESIAKCAPDEKLALLFIDLDCFKLVNDNQGHPFGDQVLRDIAMRLRAAFRREDIVGRVGGDEFLVLLKNIISREDAEKRARRIFGFMPFECADGEQMIKVTCSVGVALSGPNKTLEQLYEEADKAMYRAKKAGKNTLAFY